MKDKNFESVVAVTCEEERSHRDTRATLEKNLNSPQIVTRLLATLFVYVLVTDLSGTG